MPGHLLEFLWYMYMILNCAIVSEIFLYFQMYLGGVDSFNKIGLKTQYNFHGCIDFVRYNHIHLIRDAKYSTQQQGFQVSRFRMNGPVDSHCIVSRNNVLYLPQILGTP